MQRKEDMYVVKEGEIVTLYFNRPEKRNAINYEMWKTLPEILADLDSDPTVKVLILRGVDHTAFSSGADISEFSKLRSNDQQALQYNQCARAAVDSLIEFSKPTIALIQGYCVGGGNEIALVCDFRFTDSSGRFGITPSKLGIIYSLRATKRIFDLVGPANTKEILMTGQIFTAEEAKQMGLVDKVFIEEELEIKTKEFARLIAERSQLTVRAVKKIVSELVKGTTDDTEELRKMVFDSYNSEDYKEGVSAFMEKRKPNFKYS